ncbi:MAG: HAD-IA family hydrolase [Burkholderiales bacterium]|nr:HAD-IA family hydrolase [Burkholderiales bacterium]
MPDPRYRLIVFDWDGTLIDSAATIVECIQAASRDMGLPVPTPERASHVIGLGLHDALRIAVPDLQAERAMAFVACYREHFLAREDRMRLFEGIEAVLESLRARGHRLAIAPGKSRRGLERALDASGLRAHFVASRCADETRPKPHPAMLEELMSELDVDASAALMIGDTSHDLEMARDARVDAVAVTYGAHPEAALRALAPLACVGSVGALQEWLTRNA